MTTSDYVLNRTPVHPSITEQQISDMVELFYLRVQKDQRLGPVFKGRLDGRWPEHLTKMKDFWSSVLLRTGRFKGKPMPAHMQLTESQSEDFRIWLSIFRPTAQEIFEPEAVPFVVEAAERIAQSLWMAMFGSPFDAIPDWINAQETHPDYAQTTL